MPARTKVFISYSHQDEEWLKRLRVHLRPLERDQDIDIWDDTKIPPGSKWRQDIASTIAATKVAILLISADFLASDFIAADELPPLLAAAEAEGATILPVIVSPSRFATTKTLSAFQAVNPPSRPLIEISRSEQEAVFVRVAEIIETMLSTTTGGAAANAPSAAHVGEAAPSSAPAPGPSPEAVRRTLEEMHALFEQIHQEYLDSFRRYRDLIRTTRENITAAHPVVDAIRSDHVFSGGPRAKLLAMTDVDGSGALKDFASAVERYLTGIRRKETYFQLPNAPRMDFQRELEGTFAATPAQHSAQLNLLRKNARAQEHLRRTDPGHPLLALLDGNTPVTAEQSNGVKEHEILKMLDAIVEKTQAQYAKVTREYLAAKKAAAGS